MRQPQRSAQEDRPDALARRQRGAERRHQADALDVGGAHRFVVLQRLVAARILQRRRLADQRAVLVEHRDRAEVVVLVIDEPQHLVQRLRRRRLVLRRARQVEDAGVDAQHRQHVVDVAGRVAGDLLGDRQLVLLQRAAQRALSDAQRRVAGDRDRQRRDREREQGQLGQQLHGAPRAGGRVHAAVGRIGWRSSLVDERIGQRAPASERIVGRDDPRRRPARVPAGHHAFDAVRAHVRTGTASSTPPIERSWSSGSRKWLPAIAIRVPPVTGPLERVRPGARSARRRTGTAASGRSRASPVATLTMPTPGSWRGVTARISRRADRGRSESRWPSISSWDAVGLRRSGTTKLVPCTTISVPPPAGPIAGRQAGRASAGGTSRKVDRQRVGAGSRRCRPRAA